MLRCSSSPRATWFIRDAGGIVVRRTDGSEVHIAASLARQFFAATNESGLGAADGPQQQRAFRDPHHTRPRRLLSASRVSTDDPRACSCFACCCRSRRWPSFKSSCSTEPRERQWARSLNVGTAAPGDTLRHDFTCAILGDGPASAWTLALSGAGLHDPVRTFPLPTYWLPT